MSLANLLDEKANKIMYEKRVTTIDGHPIIYYVLPCDALGNPDFSPIAEYFAGKCGYNAFYISEAIPEEFRLPILAHEFYEYREPYDPSKRRCRHHEAIKHEVSTARELGILPEYLEFRLGLYYQIILYLHTMDNKSNLKKLKDMEEDMRLFKAVKRKLV